MTTDRYMKAVLTVIAGCLLWICVMGTAGPLSAQQGSTADSAVVAGRVQPVIIVGTGSVDAQGNIAVNFVGRNNAKVTDPTIPVRLPYSAEAPLPVRLPYSAEAPLPVRLPYTTASPLPAQLLYSAATPLPVEITGIKKTREWEPIRTQVEDAPLRRTPGLPERQ
jgi:hypothetical protein